MDPALFKGLEELALGFFRAGEEDQAGGVHIQAMQGIDRRLILGSALFGIGWGLAGICPGPALVLLGLGHWDTLVFLVAMVAGMGGWQYWQRRVN